VALVLLKDTPLFRHVIPSKMFEAMATARPIILGVQGESADVLVESGAGIAIPPESPEALSRAIESLMDDPRACEAFGTAGRRFVERKFDRNQLGLKMLEVLEGVASRWREHR
jgi:glycosyltransferase involved in cell wall biosynthesis